MKMKVFSAITFALAFLGCDAGLDPEFSQVEVRPMKVTEVAPMEFTIENQLSGALSDNAITLSRRYVGEVGWEILRIESGDSVKLQLPVEPDGIEVMLEARAHTYRQMVLGRTSPQLIRIDNESWPRSTNQERQAGYFTFHCIVRHDYPDGGFATESIGTRLTCRPEDEGYHCDELLKEDPYKREYFTLSYADLNIIPSGVEVAEVVDTGMLEPTGYGRQIALMPRFGQDATGFDACRATLYEVLSPTDTLVCVSDGNPDLGD